MDKLIEEKLIAYQEEGFVFKSCDYHWIVVLEKTPNTQTNDSRKNIVDMDHASFRGSVFVVKDIVHKSDVDKKTDSVCTMYMDQNTNYIIGEVVVPDKYDESDEILSHGIHYYNSYIRAYYYETRMFDREEYKEWYDNGQIMTHQTEDTYDAWYMNGQKNIECIYKNDNSSLFVREWYEDGGLKSESESNHVNGECREWYENGQLKNEYKYTGDKSNQVSRGWYEDGEPRMDNE